MGPGVFTEGGYQLSFSEKWNVFKYDEHKYYKIVSGRSFSGVDIAGIYNDERLYLIELKNFYQHTNKGVIDDYENFISEMREKFLDTLDLVRIIHKYHTRKWVYRTFYPLVAKFPKLYLNWWVWTKMHIICQDMTKVNFVLVIDSILETSKINEDLRTALQEEAIVTRNIIVRSYNELKFDGLILSSLS